MTKRRAVLLAVAVSLVAAAAYLLTPPALTAQERTFAGEWFGLSGHSPPRLLRCVLRENRSLGVGFVSGGPMDEGRWDVTGDRLTMTYSTLPAGGGTFVEKMAVAVLRPRGHTQSAMIGKTAGPTVVFTINADDWTLYRDREAAEAKVADAKAAEHSETP